MSKQPKTAHSAHWKASCLTSRLAGQAQGCRTKYQYDSLGQVISGKKYWSDGTPVAGEQFEYSFDDIGNRRSTKTGGDQFGANLRSANYANNTLNELTSRSVPGYADILGSAAASAIVTVNNQPTYRKGEYFRQELPANNSTGALWLSITNLAVLNNGTNADIVVTNTGNFFLPKTAEVFGYDADGNLTNNARWAIGWDAENRATSFTSLTNTPSASRKKIECAYDSQWRRTQKIVSTWNGSAYVPLSTNRFVYDGWNLIAILNETNGLLYSFSWGLDLSGTMQGAGGVGGLISMTVHSGSLAGTYFYAFDGNGNVAALVNAADGTVTTRYEHGPFGELIRATGPLAFINPFLFSTKFYDHETGFYYCGYRYYDPGTGRWLSRDPIGEQGGTHLYALLGNDEVDDSDYLGLSWWKDFKIAEKTGELVLKNGKRLLLRNRKFRNTKVTIEMLRTCGDVSEKGEKRLKALEKRYGKDLTIKFDAAAQPSFSRFDRANGKIKITLTGDHRKDSEAAWKQLEQVLDTARADVEKANSDVELVWHHAGNGRMELIDRDLNTAFAHTGEAAAARAMGELAALAAPGVSALYTEKVQKGKCSCAEAFIVTFVDGVRWVDPGIEDVGRLMFEGSKIQAEREVEDALKGKPRRGPAWAE